MREMMGVWGLNIGTCLFNTAGAGAAEAAPPGLAPVGGPATLPPPTFATPLDLCTPIASASAGPVHTRR